MNEYAKAWPRVSGMARYTGVGLASWTALSFKNFVTRA